MNRRRLRRGPLQISEPALPKQSSFLQNDNSELHWPARDSNYIFRQSVGISNGTVSRAKNEEALRTWRASKNKGRIAEHGDGLEGRPRPFPTQMQSKQARVGSGSAWIAACSLALSLALSPTLRLRCLCPLVRGSEQRDPADFDLAVAACRPSAAVCALDEF